MLTYLVQRLLVCLATLWCVSLLTFLLGRFAPGDPVQMQLGIQATPARVAELRHQLGLDAPLPLQYGRYLYALLRGDLGYSLRGGTSVRDELLLRLPSTLALTVSGALLTLVLGVPSGLLWAFSKSRALHLALVLATAASLALPTFWLAPLLVLLFGVWLEWLPVADTSGWSSLLLPSVCVALAPAALLARVTRSSVVTAWQQGYVRTARAKGLALPKVVMGHVLPNILLPLLSTSGLLLAALLNGSVFVEAAFGRPGVGRMAVEAALNRDYPQIQALALWAAATYMGINLVADLLAAACDPRRAPS